MKYVIIRAPLYGNLYREIPIVFAQELNHSDVAKALLTLKDCEGGVVVGAGEVTSTTIEDRKVVPTGSITLEMKKGRTEDGHVIMLHDYFHGLGEYEEGEDPDPKHPDERNV